MEEAKFVKVPIEISARHIHITQKDFLKLFGKKEPTLYKKIGQGQFAAKEVLEIRNGKRFIKNVRIVAPFREKNQVEISLTDAINLRIKPVIRMSGNLEGTPGLELVGPKGKLKLKKGAIVAQRHLHLNEKEAKKLGLRHRDVISILVRGKRAVLFGNVIVRVNKKFNACVHLDTDEGNACGISKKGIGYLSR